MIKSRLKRLGNMKRLIIILMIIPFTTIIPQKIGKLADEKPSIEFPDNSWGMDIMFSEGGFGLGTFFRKALSDEITAFADFSFSESKDDKEVEYVDIFGRIITPGKLNRVFMLPLNAGIQYRLFSSVLTDNLRPYLNFGIGPTLVVTTPYEREFFNAFGKARAHYALGGYAGFGANFGISTTNLVGVNIRYYYTHLFGDGVENLRNRFRKDIGGFYLTINVGIMY